ncbi:hypothetical protein [Aquimarina pacifica]|uniref:hypothetical protein n=1 Tax=Aquimarina pacifica TaxID=1296415 RepID=UPI00046EDCBD|nr:hypothetical protein [Aquimarina pacifica]
MKKLYNLLILFSFVATITYGNTHTNKATIISNNCKDYYKPLCIYKCSCAYSLNNNLVSISNFQNYFYSPQKDTVFIEQIPLAQLNNKVSIAMNKLKMQEDHLNDLLKKKRSQYQLYKVNVFGQLTSPVNTEINYHKSQPPRTEGFGLRFRF